MDMKAKAKSKVLQQLIEMMDERMVDDLKEKSPKFAKVDIASDDPELAENLKDKLIEGIAEDSVEAEPSKPVEELSMDKMEVPAEDDEDDMKRLLEMYKNLK